MKKLIVLTILLMIGTANAAIYEIEYKKVADNMYEGRTQYGRSLVYTKNCSIDISPRETWLKGFVQEEKVGEISYFTLVTKYMSCPVMDLEDLE